MAVARSKPLFFSLCALGVGVVVAAGGWLTDARLVMHGALLFVGAIAFLPFVLIACGLLVGVVFAVAAGFAAAAGGDANLEPVVGAAGDLAGAGAEGMAPYYRRLFRMKHPALWGALSGLVLGGIALFCLLAVLVAPGERETGRTLASQKDRIDRAYKADSKFPEPSDDDTLVDEDGDEVRDAFGRPLRYDVSGAWKLSSYKVVSLGYDGKPSGDDLCVSGSTKALEWGKGIKDVVGALQGESSTADGFAGIRALRCD